MRSLRYLLGGNPHNLDDCLDLAPSSEATVFLRGVYQRVVCNESFETEADLWGRYQWNFRDLPKPVVYSKRCGSVPEYLTAEMSWRVILSRLEEDNQRIRDAGIPLIIDTQALYSFPTLQPRDITDTRLIPQR